MGHTKDILNPISHTEKWKAFCLDWGNVGIKQEEIEENFPTGREYI